MKKYLVTGGAGFIGGNFVRYLVDRYGDDVAVTVVDSLTYAGNVMTIADELKRPGVSFVKADIGDSVAIDAVLADFDPDYVVNFAAETHVDRSILNPRLFLETNVLGTHNLLECARRAWIEGKDETGRPVYRSGKKFLQISTDEVYGSLEKDFDRARPLAVAEAVASVAAGRDDIMTFGSRLFTEETPLAPRSPYSASKTSADLLVTAYHETFGLPVNITRCSNNYGPCQFPEKLIPLVIKNILEGKKIPVYGKGENVRDWLYVDDHCKAIDMVLRGGRVGEVYNIGGFNEESNINIVRAIIATVRRIMEREPARRGLLSCDLRQIDESLISYVADRPGHDLRYAIDPAKIAVELGWYPETPFAEGIGKTVLWYLDNQDWVDAVVTGDYQKYYDRMYLNR